MALNYWVPIMFEPEDQLLGLAQAVEAAGFTGVALADHVAVPVGFESVHPSGENPFDHTSSFPDPLTTAAAMLVTTTRLQVMSYVLVLPLREPFSVAKQAATLAVLSGGRFRLGVGAGWLTEEISLMGQSPRARGRRMDEMIEVMGRFWREGTTEFHGEFFDFGPTGMYPLPPSPVPVWVGGKSDAAIARAVRNDGWLGMNYDLPEVYELLDRLAGARVAAGDTRADYETLVIPNAVPDPELYADLEARGVTSTIAMPWYPGDPAYASLDAKREALEAFADTFIRGR